MPAIASLEDLRAAQKVEPYRKARHDRHNACVGRHPPQSSRLMWWGKSMAAKDLDELKAAFKRWRKLGWKNICKLWLQERTPEQLKGAE